MITARNGVAALVSKKWISEFFRRGGAWVIAQALLMALVLVTGLLWGDSWRAVALGVCGVVLLGAAALTGIAGAWALGRSLTPFPQPSCTGRLVQRGVYGLMRHPLYTAVILASIGWALFEASWPAMVGAGALALLLDAKARREELWLRQQFPEYSDYEKRVRRFLPWIY